MSEHTFVMPKDTVNAVVQWLYRHDIERTHTSYVYDSFYHKGADIRKDPAFRGIRVYITSDELAIMFKLMFGEQIKENCTRANDSGGYFGFRF